MCVWGGGGSVVGGSGGSHVCMCVSGGLVSRSCCGGCGNGGRMGGGTCLCERPTIPDSMELCLYGVLWRLANTLTALSFFVELNRLSTPSAVGSTWGVGVHVVVGPTTPCLGNWNGWA